MSELHIITNGHIRPVLYWSQLTEEERSWHDWIEEGREDEYTFFRYKGQSYCIEGEIVPVEKNQPSLAGWHGYINDTFFSGILFRYSASEWDREELDTDYVVVGWYYC